MKYPTVNTKFIVLLGNPLSHSVSPPMHNAVFEKLGMDCCYIPVEVNNENLGKVFQGLSRMNVLGCNVTIPHKVAIMDYLDELDPLAKTIGAVNTIKIENGSSTGYNTDGEGFLKSLTEGGLGSVTEKRFFIQGCGGAARAVAMTLAAHNAKRIYLANRTEKKAEQLADEINLNISSCSEVIDNDPASRKTAIRASDVLINTTSVGMHPHENASPIEKEYITADHMVADIVYNPLKTKLLQDAEAQGAKTVGGPGMLIYQGAAAFRIFTGVEPLVDVMSATVYRLIDKKQAGT